MTEKNFTKQLMDEAEKIQNESREIIKGIMTASPELSYQDAMNIFLFTKLGQMQIQVDMLLNAIRPIGAIILFTDF